MVPRQMRETRRPVFPRLTYFMVAGDFIARDRLYGSAMFARSKWSGPISLMPNRLIRVIVESFYVPERSEPTEHYFFFAYRVRIANEGDETAKLISREWVITDGDGNQQVVRGEGVVGEQPLLQPGEAYEYTS